MKRRTLTISLATLVFFFALSTSAAVLIASELRLGMNSAEVKLLQKILNTDPDTEVALIGAGSDGLETEYFGTKTLLALIRFQRKYYQQIGFQSPNDASGVVDDLTRVFINSSLEPEDSSIPVQTQDTGGNVYNIPDSISSPSSFLFSSSTQASIKDFKSNFAATTTNPLTKTYGVMYTWLNSPQTKRILDKANLTADYFLDENWKQYPHILSLSPSESSPGDAIILTGIDLNDPNLAIAIDGQSIPFSRISASTFRFVIPETTSYGVHQISVLKDGKTYQKNPVTMLVKKKGSNHSFISSVTSTASTTNLATDTFVIKGANFSTKNDIITTFGVIKDVPKESDGSIKFAFSSAPYFSMITKARASSSALPLSGISTIVLVKNEYGTSNYFGPINLKI